MALPKGWSAAGRFARVCSTGIQPRNRVREATVKELKCRDAGFDCDAVVHGDTVDDVMAQAGPHAKEAHGVDVTPEMAGRIKTLVHDA
jgi:predicted small metal-binding protein